MPIRDSRFIEPNGEFPCTPRGTSVARKSGTSVGEFSQEWGTSFSRWAPCWAKSAEIARISKIKIRRNEILIGFNFMPLQNLTAAFVVSFVPIPPTNDGGWFSTEASNWTNGGWMVLKATRPTRRSVMMEIKSEKTTTTTGFSSRTPAGKWRLRGRSRMSTKGN